MKAKIVIIDDDKVQIRQFKQALSAADFEVILVSETLGLVPIFEGKEHQNATFFLVDMVMPAGKLYEKEETANGMYTGLFVSRDLRKKFPAHPIILWTSAHVDEVLKAAEKHASKIHNCHYTKKIDMSPSELVDELTYFLEKGKFRSNVFKLLWKVARVGGGLLGFGADFKEISS